MKDKIIITKATGEREAFDSNKLRQSLLRSKADPQIVDEIIERIGLELKDGMTTAEIYRNAFALLKEKHKKASVRYSLRNAVMDMGPTGFPFEKLIAEIWRAKGFESTTDYIAKGKCVEHEIDVAAWNQEKLIMIEAKFHNEFGIKSDLKTVLYVNSRWADLEGEIFDGVLGDRKLSEGWLITNTKFTEQAIKYAECRKMNLVGWNYPETGNLQDLIEENNMHPITSLKSIGPREERLLMEAGIVLCKQAKENQDIVRQVGIGGEQFVEMMQEIDLIQQ